MSTKTELLRMLQKSGDAYVSGQQIAEQLQVSRNAIWKAVTQLKKEGYAIEGRSKAGYRLTAKPNLLSAEDIQRQLTVDCDLQVHRTVTSTNTLGKEVPLGDKPLVILADQQTAGRGRLGRTFESPSGTGLYMTIVLQPDFELTMAPMVTMAQAVSTCRAVERVCGVAPSIKWVNDLFLAQKKVCGILTEAQTNFETGKIDRLIIGIGLNCFPGSFPSEIAHIAGPLADSPEAFSRNDLAAALINESLPLLSALDPANFLPDYRQRCMVLGKPIHIHPNYDAEAIPAKALAITDDGGLLVEYGDASTEVLHTGEISISLAP